jgi:hypothetical protein
MSKASYTGIENIVGARIAHSQHPSLKPESRPISPVHSGDKFPDNREYYSAAKDFHSSVEEHRPNAKEKLKKLMWEELQASIVAIER